MIQVSEEKDERARIGGQWILEREPHFALPEPERQKRCFGGGGGFGLWAFCGVC